MSDSPNDIDQLGALIRAHVVAKRMNAGFSAPAFAAELRAIAADVENGNLVFKRGVMVLDEFNAADDVTRLVSMSGELVFAVKA